MIQINSNFAETAFKASMDDDKLSRQFDGSAKESGFGRELAGLLASPLKESKADEAAIKAEEKATKAAQDLVAITFIQPMFKIARQDPFKSEMFHGGAAEDAFGAQLDDLMADQMVKADGMGLVQAVKRQILANEHAQTIAADQRDKTNDKMTAQNSKEQINA